MDDNDPFEERTRITFEVPHKSSQSPANFALVTYAGSADGFANIQEPFRRDISASPFSWKRTYGQVREVYCHVQFQKWHERTAVETATDSTHPAAIDFLGPILHTFWCDGQSLDVYKSNGKSQITMWFEQLEAQQIQDWMIIVLVRPDVKRAPHRTRPSPRLEVYDRVMTDFCSKARDRNRCSFIMDSRSGLGDADAWHGTIAKFRHLIYDAYETKLRNFEEQLRIARENRAKADFKLSEYVSLRESLATAYQRLTFPEEALQHLDELSLILSQFILEASQSLADSTVRAQCAVPPKKWLGINIANKSRTAELKEMLCQGTGHISLLDMRSFLFVRQYELLVELGRTWEVTSRAMPFVQNVIQESRMFSVPMIPGALDCWTFLTCHEIRQLTQKGSGDGIPSTNNHDHATLLGLEREKLERLGFLCGLMPNQKPTTDQTSLTAALSEAMAAPLVSTAVVKLYEALLSTEKFMKAYLELSEMAMGTFKHVGRTRAAKLLGIDLAKFYMSHGSFDKASGFLLDALKMLRRETWALPCADVARLYNQCVQETKQWDQVIKSALLVASCPGLDASARLEYMDMFTDTVAATEGDRDKLLLCNGLFLTSFAPNSLDSQTETIVVNQCHDITVTLDNRLPCTLPIVRCTLVLRSNNSANLKAFSQSPVPVSENFFMDVSGGGVLGGVSRVPLQCTATIAKTEAGVSVPWVKCTSPHSGSRSYRSESFDVANATDDLTIECRVAELTPGSQELTFTHQYDVADTYRAAELHIQYVETYRMIVVFQENFLLEVLAEPPACQLVPLFDPSSECWMHTPYAFRLSCSVPETARLKDIVASVKPADDGCVQICDRQGVLIAQDILLLRSTHYSYQLQLSCTAEDVDHTAETLVRLPWSTAVPQSFRFTFHAPLTVSTSAHFCAPTPGLGTTLITAAVTNRWTKPVFLLPNIVLLDAQDRPLKPITDTSKAMHLQPTNTIRFIWSSQDPDLEASQSLRLNMPYSCAPAVEAGSPCILTVPFSTGIFGAMRLVVKVALQPEHCPVYVVGEAVKAVFTISPQRLAEKRFPVVFQIKYDQSFWASTSEASGHIELNGGEDFVIEFNIVPIKTGSAVFPTLRLFHLRNEDILPVEGFHVYNESIHRAVTIVSKRLSAGDVLHQQTAPPGSQSLPTAGQCEVAS